MGESKKASGKTLPSLSLSFFTTGKTAIDCRTSKTALFIITWIPVEPNFFSNSLIFSRASFCLSVTSPIISKSLFPGIYFIKLFFSASFSASSASAEQ